MKSRVPFLLHCECIRMSDPNGEKGRVDVTCMELVFANSCSCFLLFLEQGDSLHDLS